MCEGLKMNVSFELLNDIRRLFGVGFLLDAKEKLQNVNPMETLSTKRASPEVDTNFLFSTNRIIYSIVKSLPHFFCLSYVTTRLTATFIKKLLRLINEKIKPNKARNRELIYTKSIYEQIYQLNECAKKNLSFEDRYVRGLFMETKLDKLRVISWLERLKIYWYQRRNFRFSTRVVCTFTVCFTVLYNLTCFFVFYGSIFVDLIYMPDAYKIAVLISSCLTSMICIVQVILSMRQFRIHLNSLYKGNLYKIT